VSLPKMSALSSQGWVKGVIRLFEQLVSLIVEEAHNEDCVSYTRT
jgi:hypothetical protein